MILNLNGDEKCDFLPCHLQVTIDGKTVYIVDEVGKMELFSQRFASSVRELFWSRQATILATVPVTTKQPPIPFTDELKSREDVTLIEVRFDCEVFQRVLPQRACL